jgi:hypothetical protein
MELKEAVGEAKAHVAEVFSEELAGPPTLEEVWFDSDADAWCITLGLLRNETGLGALGKALTRKEYKVVRIARKSGEFISIKNRDVALA